MKKIFAAVALAGPLALMGCSNTNVPYTRQQGALGGALLGAVIAKKTGATTSDGAIVGAIIGNLTGNPCERVLRDNLNTPGIDINGVKCDGVAATGYNMNDRTPAQQTRSRLPKSTFR